MIILSTLSDRVKLLIDNNGLSVNAAAEKINVPPPRLNDIVKGKTKNPHAKTLTKIAKGFGVSETWLLTGEEPMRSEIQDSYQGNHPQKEPSLSDDELWEQSFFLVNRLLVEFKTKHVSERDKVDIIRAVKDFAKENNGKLPSEEILKSIIRVLSRPVWF